MRLKNKNKQILAIFTSFIMMWGQSAFAETFADMFNQADNNKGKIYFVKDYGNLTIIPSLDRILEVDTQGNILDVIGVKIHAGKVHCKRCITSQNSKAVTLQYPSACDHVQWL